MRVVRIRWEKGAAVMVGALFLLADQLQKFYVYNHFAPNQTIPLLGSWLMLTRVPNSGLIFQSHAMVFEPKNVLFTRYLPTVALAVLFFAYWWPRLALASSLSRRCRQLADMSFALVFAGGLSNVISHWRGVFVDDTFLVAPFFSNQAHPFNLADFAITLGIFLLSALLISDWVSGTSPSV